MTTLGAGTGTTSRVIPQEQFEIWWERTKNVGSKCRGVAGLGSKVAGTSEEGPLLLPLRLSGLVVGTSSGTTTYSTTQMANQTSGIQLFHHTTTMTGIEDDPL